MSEYTRKAAEDHRLGYRGIRLIGYAVSVAALLTLLGVATTTAIAP